MEKMGKQKNHCLKYSSGNLNGKNKSQYFEEILTVNHEYYELGLLINKYCAENVICLSLFIKSVQPGSSIIFLKRKGNKNELSMKEICFPFIYTRSVVRNILAPDKQDRLNKSQCPSNILQRF